MFFEYHYPNFLHKCLTADWKIIQFGWNLEAKQLWWKIFQVLELDKKARFDLVLLAQSGGVGRT